MACAPRALYRAICFFLSRFDSETHALYTVWRLRNALYVPHSVFFLLNAVRDREWL